MMENFSETLVIERNRLFVGRNAELETIHNWIRNVNMPTQALFVSGIGGVGKTSFMMRALDLAIQADKRALWIDGRVCTETPTGFVEALFDPMKALQGLPYSSEPLLGPVIHELSSERTLLCVDNYDAIPKLDRWLRDAFLPRLPSTGLLILLVARQNLSEAWKHDLAWRNRVTHMELKPLNKQEVTQYGFRHGIRKSEDIERLYHDSQGLPLALALTSEKLHLAGKETWLISVRISAELLREVTSPGLQETLDLLSIMPQATPEQLGRWLRSPLSADMLLQLSRLSFVRPTAYGLALHDVARHYLMEDLMRRNPERVHRLRTHIIRELIREIRSSHPRDRNRRIAVLLSTCRYAFQLDSVSVFPLDPEPLQLEPFQQRDLPALLQILQGQASYAVSIHKDRVVLQELAEQFPDCIRVFRSQDGTPLAFAAGFYLYADTVRFHEKHFPEVLERAFPSEIDAMRTRAIDQADTFYHLLAAASDQDAEYSLQQLIGIIILNSLIVHTAGLRFVIINTYEGITSILLRLGYRMRPLEGLPDAHPFRQAIVRELDWHVSDIGDRIVELLGIALEDADTPVPNPITEKMMMSALPLVKDLNRLAHTDLANSLGLTGRELQHALSQLLWGNLIYPLDHRMQQTLRLMSEEAHLIAEAAADRLHVSRATYFRIRKDALGVMREFLLRSG